MSAMTIERPWQRWLIRLGVFISMVILVVPGAWVVLTAFRQNIEILAKPAVWIPQQITFHNFQGIFGLLSTQQGLPVASYFVNSLVISVTSTVVASRVAVASSMAALLTSTTWSGAAGVADSHPIAARGRRDGNSMDAHPINSRALVRRGSSSTASRDLGALPTCH